MNLNGCNNFTWYIGCQVLCAATAEIEFKTSEYSLKKSQTLMCIIYWLLVLTPSSMQKKKKKPWHHICRLCCV